MPALSTLSQCVGRWARASPSREVRGPLALPQRSAAAGLLALALSLRPRRAVAGERCWLRCRERLPRVLQQQRSGRGEADV